MIKIKYRKGNIVFYIENDKVCKGEIYSGYIIFNSDVEDQYKVYYYLQVDNRILDKPFKEEFLFETGEELAKS